MCILLAVQSVSVSLREFWQSMCHHFRALRHHPCDKGNGYSYTDYELRNGILSTILVHLRRLHSPFLDGA